MLFSSMLNFPSLRRLLPPPLFTKLFSKAKTTHHYNTLRSAAAASTALALLFLRCASQTTSAKFLIISNQRGGVSLPFPASVTPPHKRGRKRNRTDGVPPLSMMEGFLGSTRARKLRKLFKEKQNEITYPQFPSDNVGSFSFSFLEPLVDAVKNREVLDIIDYKPHKVLDAIRTARGHFFGGPWIDTLEDLIDKNQKYSKRQTESVEDELDGLRSDMKSLKKLLKSVEEKMQEKVEMKMVEEKMKFIKTPRETLKYIDYLTPEE